MINHHTTEIFFDGLRVPAANRTGEEGMGFRYVLDGMNVERILIAAESIGDGGWFIERSVVYANELALVSNNLVLSCLAQHVSALPRNAMGEVQKHMSPRGG